MTLPVSSDDLEVNRLERRWTACKALLAIMIGIWVGVNILWLALALKTGTGLWWGDSATVAHGDAPGLPKAVHHDDGILADSVRLGAFVIADVVILGFWFWLMDLLGDAENDGSERGRSAVGGYVPSDHVPSGSRLAVLERKFERLNTVLATIALVSLIGITLLGSFLLPYFVIRYGWVKS